MTSLPKSAALAAFVAVAPVITAANAVADVSWDFILTAATNPTCPSCPPPVPLPEIGGSLTVSDTAFFRGSVSYTFFIESDQFENHVLDAEGDTDFGLEMGVFSLPVSLLTPHLVPGTFGDVGLGISRDGVLSGWLIDNLNFDSLRMEIGNSVVTNALWLSDDGAPGCGPFACEFDGYWQLTSGLPLQVPEPSSAAILLGAIAVLGSRARRMLSDATTAPSEQ